MSMNEAFVTLATKDEYACGALVLAQSLRQVQTTKKLVVMISIHLSDHLKNLLKESFDEVIPVEQLNTHDDEHLRLLGRPELGITLTKINCWLLTNYSKCVFMDSDTLVLKNIDHLFEREEFSAAPDAGWPDCFNSGVFVYRPSKETFRQIMLFSSSSDNSSFDGGDQGLLNSFFSDWNQSDLSRHLPFTHNVTANTFYSYLPAIQKFHQDIHVVHFAGSTKPWHLTYNPSNDHLSGNISTQNSIQRDFLLSWWKIFSKDILPKFSSTTQNFTETTNSSSIDKSNRNENLSLTMFFTQQNDSIASGSAQHRRAWESGHIDYQGKDSFDNILHKLNETIHQTNPFHLKHSIQSDSSSSSSVSSSKVEEKKQIEIKPSESLPPPPPMIRSTPTPTPTPTSTSTPSTSSVEKSESIVKDNSNERTKGNEWTVKSTIITAHQQGLGEFAGPTTISKVITESIVSSNEIQSIRSDSTENIEKKKIDHHSYWIFNKAFLALTYTISLVYFFFIFLFRKSSDKHSIDNVEDKSSSSRSTKIDVKRQKD